MGVKSAVIDQFLGLRTDTPSSKCSSEYSPDCSDVVFTVGGFATRPPFLVELTMPAEIVYEQEFQGRDGNTYRMVVDINGAMYSVAPDGTYAQIDSVAPGSQVASVTAYGRNYMAFFNENGGCDAPRQWDGKNLYRVAQGGPGSPPIFMPTEISTDRYPISSITQPAVGPYGPGFAFGLQSTGPGASGPGSAGIVVTQYYADATSTSGDPDLIAAFNSGNPTYVHVALTNALAGFQNPTTALVTGVGVGVPPGEARNFYYFTYNAPTSQALFSSGHGGYGITYQRTIATVTTSVPIPDVVVGSSITIIGTSVSAWNSNWVVAQTPLSGSLSINQTSLTAGTATYNYSIFSGVAPTVGQTITIAGTYNAGGILNVTNGVIATCTGGASGSFTIDGFAGPDFGAVSESGTGVTAGTEFLIEPALPVVGTATSPIYGNSTGGFVVFAGAASTIASGNRQGVMFFINDNDLTTAPSIISKFTVPANTNAIAASQLLIGPPNVKARGVAFTPANGSRFFYMPIPASVNGVVTGTSTVVNDNTSDTATFQFTDDALQSGIEIDIPGNNLFQQVTLDTPSGVEWYDDRMFWWGGRNKVTSLINMEMDGGTALGDTKPAGWTTIGTGGAVQQVGSAPAYVITGPGNGEISQGAATTQNGSPILQPNTSYTLRFWTNGTVGTAVGSLMGTGFGALINIPLTPGYIEGALSVKTPAVIPDDLTFHFSVNALGSAGSVAVRDLQLIYTDNPNRNPQARSSYTQNPEAYDQLTGNIGPNDDNTELRAAFVLQESLHFITAKALYYVSAIGNSEPSSWDPRQVSDKCGAFHANAVTTGKGWAAWAGTLGVFRYRGGVPENLANVIFPTWKMVSSVTTMLDDPLAQRIYIAIETGGGRSLLPLDYHEIEQGGPAKWAPWNRPVRWISNQGFAVRSKVYVLGTGIGINDDDLGPIAGYYTFAPFAAGIFQNQYDYLGFRISGTGPMTPFLYQKRLSDAPYILNMSPLEDLLDTVAEWQSLGLRGRNLYLKLGQPGVGYQVEQVAAAYQLDPNAPISGVR